MKKRIKITKGKNILEIEGYNKKEVREIIEKVKLEESSDEEKNRL